MFTSGSVLGKAGLGTLGVVGYFGGSVSDAARAAYENNSEFFTLVSYDWKVSGSAGGGTYADFEIYFYPSASQADKQAVASTTRASELFKRVVVTTER